jgi:hypothetical protein
MKLRFKLIFYFIILIFLFACSDKSRNDLTNPVVYLNNFGPSWTIYGDSLNVADCDICYYVNNPLSNINFQYKEGNNTAIKLYWNGSISENKTWYGFYLQFKNVKNLTDAGYNRIRFSIKGNLNSNIMEITGFIFKGYENLNDADKAKYTFDKLSLNATNISETEYKTKELPITVDLANVYTIIGFAVKSTSRDDMNSEDATVFIDNIELVKV